MINNRCNIEDKIREGDVTEEWCNSYWRLSDVMYTHVHNIYHPRMDLALAQIVLDTLHNVLKVR